MTDRITRVHRQPSVTAAVLLAVSALLGACSGTAADALNPPILVDVLPAASVVAPGATLDVTVRITNRGTNPVSVNAAPCPDLVEARTPLGVVVPARGQICPAIFQPLTIGVGQSVQLPNRWRAERAEGNEQVVPLAPGTYLLTARVAVDEDGTVGVSRAVRVEVRP